MVFAKHRHESAMGACVAHPETPSHLPPHPIPQGHPSVPALSTLSHASNLDWQSTSHMIICTFQRYIHFKRKLQTLMNTDAKIEANQIQQYVKRKIHYNQIGFTSRCRVGLQH